VPLDSRSLAWSTLAQKHLPSQALVALLRHFGNPEALLAASRARIAAVTSPALADRVGAPLDAGAYDRTARWLDDPAHQIVAWDDADYPPALLALPDAPPALYMMGRRELLSRTGFAIVGSRHGTPQGLATAREFAHALAGAGLTIVSGLALGIDAAAHEGALETDASTIAIVGTGLDRVYPARNRALAVRIAERGALLSEYAPGTPARKENFPQRNRLISGMSCGVLVVEATLSSGSLITARLAGDQGRDVFAIPGSIHSPFSKGCHKLIREGAKLVETAQDVLDELRGTPRIDARACAPTKHAAPTPLLAAMGYDPVTIDVLIERVRAPADTIAAELVVLELDGRVSSLPGGRWQRVAHAENGNTRSESTP
jgi:DNA processing protein